MKVHESTRYVALSDCKVIAARTRRLASVTLLPEPRYAWRWLCGASTKLFNGLGAFWVWGFTEPGDQSTTGFETLVYVWRIDFLPRRSHRVYRGIIGRSISSLDRRSSNWKLRDTGDSPRKNAAITSPRSTLVQKKKPKPGVWICP